MSAFYNWRLFFSLHLGRSLAIYTVDLRCPNGNILGQSCACLSWVRLDGFCIAPIVRPAFPLASNLFRCMRNKFRRPWPEDRWQRKCTEDETARKCQRKMCATHKRTMRCSLRLCWSAVFRRISPKMLLNAKLFQELAGSTLWKWQNIARLNRINTLHTHNAARNLQAHAWQTACTQKNLGNCLIRVCFCALLVL